MISSLDPGFGFYANVSKTWLVTKAEFKSEAAAIFADTNLQITSEGRPHLGAPLGCSTYVSHAVCLSEGTTVVNGAKNAL